MGTTIVYVVIVCVLVLAALAGLTVFLIAPGKCGDELRAPFMGRNFAHRGLYLKDQSVSENSLKAFKLAAEAGYGIEFDVHITADGELIVFHDDDTIRVCGVGGKLEQRTLAEIRKLRLFGTESGIPTLHEVLETVADRVPLIVELKSGHDNTALCRKVLETMENYTGHWCAESFDPAIVLWFRKNAPEVLRGQLSARYHSLRESGGRLASFVLSRLLTNFLTRPQFIAYEIGGHPFTVRLCERMGAMRVAWTSRDEKTEETNDAVIFQFYTPRVKFK